MDKVAISPNVFIPMPVVLVGTLASGRPNFMPVGWCSRANANPPMIACGIAKMHHTHAGICDTRVFSVNIPSASLMEKTDYCGLVSGAEVDKSSIFDVWYGTPGGPPMIRECPVTMECMLVTAIGLPTNTVFVGEITGAYAEANVLRNDRPDYAAIDPLLLTMPDNTYWTLGSAVGNAWNAGTALKKENGRETPKGK